MKKLFTLFAILALLLSLTAVAPAQETHIGTVAAIGSFGGLGNLSFGSYNSGAGVKLYVAPGTAVRAGLSYSRLDNNGTISTDYSVTGGLSFDLLSTSNTKGYLGGLVTYDHASTGESALYGMAAVAGFEVFVINNVSIGAESTLQYYKAKDADISAFVLKPPTGALLVTVYLN